MSDVRNKLATAISRMKINDPSLANSLEHLQQQEGHAAGELESIVLRTARPVIAIHNDQVAAGSLDDVWTQRLQNAKPLLDRIIPSIGRIEIANHPAYEWAGTGWLVEEGIIVTSRQAAELFVASDGRDFRFRAGADGLPMGASISMRQEEGGNGSLDFRITKVLHIEPETGSNLAFLSIEMDKQPSPLPLELETSVTADRDVALIGYGARDSRVPGIELMERIFGDVFNTKRLAPGKTVNVFSDRIIHDCSSPGSWTGAALVSLDSGKIVGLQSGGRMFENNSAIPASAIRESLFKAKQSLSRQAADAATPLRTQVDGSKSMVPFNTFQQGLQDAYLKVVLVRDSKRSQGMCTGWVLTPTLVVVPDYILSGNISTRSPLECVFINAKNEITVIAAKLVHPVKRDSNTEALDTGAALLQLQKPVRSFITRLNMQSLKEISNVYMLHFPGGKLSLQMSLSRLEKKTERLLEYPAATMGGSGGAPLLGFDGSVIGMHFASLGNMQVGLTLQAMIADLQKSKYWNDIARTHRLPEIKSAAQLKQEKARAEREAKLRDKLLFKYAVRWSIDPAKLKPADREILSQYVVDPENGSKWIMEDEERAQLIRKMGSLRKLREARGKLKIGEEGQQVIDAILKGAPYRLNNIEDKALGYWLQAIPWFSEVLPKLPSREVVGAELHRRKQHSRLSRSAGPDFRGRTEELTKMQNWYDDPSSGPMVISGIGGIGKSALISKFALQLGEKTKLFWLDFDRADLAPDKQTSVLRILMDQLSYQTTGYSPPVLTPTNAGIAENEFLYQLQQLVTLKNPALLVLDGFEVAQHSLKYNEVWPLLERLLKVANLKVIVSGRAPVKDLVLNGRKATPLPLTGLEPDASRQWLLKHGIRKEEVITRILELSNGSPLLLKLAVRYIDEGGKMGDLPSELPRVMYEGFLYQRIYNRVIDYRLREVVEDILVLRVVSPEIIREVLHDNIPGKMTPEEVFRGILRELSLVPEAGFTNDNAGETNTVATVNVRPEVRAASLKLIEYQDEKRVREIDRRAIRFYRKKKQPGDAEKKELVYHYLRLGKVAEAQKLWKQDYIQSLEDNAGDIPEKYPAARSWLQSKSGTAPLAMNLEDWEIDAYNRIKELRSRGHLEATAGILAERKERSINSRLLVYDAWNLWKQKKPEEALKLLEASANIRLLPIVHYERQIMAAKIAYLNGDLHQSARIIALLDDPAQHNRLTYGPILLYIVSSRIMYTVRESLKYEIELLELLSGKRQDRYNIIRRIEEFYRLRT